MIADNQLQIPNTAEREDATAESSSISTVATIVKGALGTVKGLCTVVLGSEEKLHNLVWDTVPKLPFGVGSYLVERNLLEEAEDRGLAIAYDVRRMVRVCTPIELGSLAVLGLSAMTDMPPEVTTAAALGTAGVFSGGIRGLYFAIRSFQYSKTDNHRPEFPDNQLTRLLQINGVKYPVGLVPTAILAIPKGMSPLIPLVGLAGIMTPEERKHTIGLIYQGLMYKASKVGYSPFFQSLRF
jgi:hypothetical protein